MIIRELTSFDNTTYVQIEPLMRQLSERIVFSVDKLKAVIDDPNSHLYCMYDGFAIIGCACLCVFYSPTGTKASIEDVVVSSDYRGQHLGKRLMEHLIAEVKELAPIELHLTSNPLRVVANKLYQSMGFEKKETNPWYRTVHDNEGCQRNEAESPYFLQKT